MLGCKKTLDILSFVGWELVDEFEVGQLFGMKNFNRKGIKIGFQIISLSHGFSSSSLSNTTVERAVPFLRFVLCPGDFLCQSDTHLLSPI